LAQNPLDTRCLNMLPLMLNNLCATLYYVHYFSLISYWYPRYRIQFLCLNLCSPFVNEYPDLLFLLHRFCKHPPPKLIIHQSFIGFRLWVLSHSGLQLTQLMNNKLCPLKLGVSVSAFSGVQIQCCIKFSLSNKCTIY
jgi:hypothetical protein